MNSDETVSQPGRACESTHDPQTPCALCINTTPVISCAPEHTGTLLLFFSGQSRMPFWSCFTLWSTQGSQAFTGEKNPGIFQHFPGPPWKFFQDFFEACECIKKKNCIHLQYSECSPLQKIQHGDKIHHHSTLYLSQQQSTQTGCYTIATCFSFEPPEKCMTFWDIFPGLSRTLSFNFQDFPGPKWFSKTC